MGHGIAERLDGTLTRDNERRVLFVGLMLENVPQFLCVDAGVLEDGDEDGDEWSLTSECCIVGVDWGAFCFEEDCPRHRTALTSLTAIDSEVLNLTGAGHAGNGCNCNLSIRFATKERRPDSADVSLGGSI